jgi:hypothetical protein
MVVFIPKIVTKPIELVPPVRLVSLGSLTGWVL